MQIYTGCSGWSYTTWRGRFYPAAIEKARWLEFYSKVFDFVEIDSSFYRIPGSFMTRKWDRLTPEHFKFTAKFPRIFTHENRLQDADGRLETFYRAMEPLKDKLLALVLQLPPSMGYKEGIKKLESFYFDKKFRYAIEVRDTSWFNENLYQLLSDLHIVLVWNQLDSIRSPPVVTSDFIYLRLIGDRSIAEKDFGKIQRDRSSEIKYWTDELSKINGDKNAINFAIIAANNHYSGFGPGTVNIFRRALGLVDISWNEKYQKNIADFS